MDPADTLRMRHERRRSAPSGGPVLLAVTAVAVWVGIACEPKAPLVPGECGDGVLNLGEECDDGPLNDDSTPDKCRTDCTLPHCGDRVADTGEVCDGSDLQGHTCTTEGFAKGQIACGPDCTLDLSGCWTCGDGFASGPEECDGTDLRGLGCDQLGFRSGRLACKADCRFDYSGCVDGCGNGRKEGDEECDGSDLAGASCEALGFQGGFLGCHEDCTFDLRRCVGGCGNGVVEAGEVCDDGNRIPYDGCTECRSGSGRFQVLEDLEVCGAPQAILATDLDGDGWQDLAVGCADPDSPGVQVFMGRGAGEFSPGPKLAFSGLVSSLAVGDLNGDGATDLAAAGWTGLDATGFDEGFVAVFPGRGDGTFDASTATSEPGVWDLAAGDWNGDGVVDLVTAERNAQRLGLLVLTDSGTLTATTFLNDYGNPVAVATGDLDGDGVTDIVSARQRWGYVSFFQGLGGGAFSDATVRVVAERPTDILVGPANADPFPDLLVPCSEDGVLAVVLSLGQEGLRFGGQTTLEQGLGRADRGYLNGDRNLDLVVTATRSDELLVLLGSGDGSFDLFERVSVCDSPTDVALLDFDHDYVLDAAVVCSFEGTMTLLRGIEAQPHEESP